MGNTDVRGSVLFTSSEYAERLTNVRRRMEAQGLSSLLVTDPANLNYLTGYNAWSFYTPQVLFVPLAGDMLFFLRAMDAQGAFRTAWLPPGNMIGYPESFVHRPHLHPFDWVADALRERGLVEPNRVGLEMDSQFFSPKAYRALETGLPEWTFVDAIELVNWVRVIKTDAEIAQMRLAARVAESAMTAAVEHVKIGVRQCDAAAAISQAQIAGTPEIGGDYTAIVPMLPTGVEADTPHLTWNDQPFEAGQAVIVELAGAHHRYHVPLARTIVLGQPSHELARLADAINDGLSSVLDLVRPGVGTRDLAEAWNVTLAAYGLEKPSRIGYSIGLAYPPDWGERTVSLRSEDDTVLQENMTFHLIGGMWMENFGCELSESIRVTTTGVETFTTFPRRLLTPNS
nr:M24 family metallopeptidase [Cryobacterium aureum]